MTDTTELIPINDVSIYELLNHYGEDLTRLLQDEHEAKMFKKHYNRFREIVLRTPDCLRTLSVDAWFNPHHMNRWIEALRDGEYKQGHSRLRDNQNRYCCLGVASDLCDPTRWESSATDGWTYDGEPTVLPDAVQKWLKIWGHNITIYAITIWHVIHNRDIPATDVFTLIRHEHESLTTMNAIHLNDAGISFETIADMLEVQFFGWS